MKNIDDSDENIVKTIEENGTVITITPLFVVVVFNCFRIFWNIFGLQLPNNFE